MASQSQANSSQFDDKIGQVKNNTLRWVTSKAFRLLPQFHLLQLRTSCFLRLSHKLLKRLHIHIATVRWYILWQICLWSSQRTRNGAVSRADNINVLILIIIKTFSNNKNSQLQITTVMPRTNFYLWSPPPQLTGHTFIHFGVLNVTEPWGHYLCSLDIIIDMETGHLFSDWS